MYKTPKHTIKSSESKLQKEEEQQQNITKRQNPQQRKTPNIDDIVFVSTV